MTGYPFQGRILVNTSYVTFKILLSGDAQSGTDKLLLSGDAQSGTDKLEQSGDARK